MRGLVWRSLDPSKEWRAKLALVLRLAHRPLHLALRMCRVSQESWMRARVQRQNSLQVRQARQLLKAPEPLQEKPPGLP